MVSEAAGPGAARGGFGAARGPCLLGRGLCRQAAGLTRQLLGAAGSSGRPAPPRAVQGKAAAPPCPIGVSDRRGVLAFRVAPSCAPRQLEESRGKGPVNYRLRQSDVLWNLERPFFSFFLIVNSREDASCSAVSLDSRWL